METIKTSPVISAIILSSFISIAQIKGKWWQKEWMSYFII